MIKTLALWFVALQAAALVFVAAAGLVPDRVVESRVESAIIDGEITEVNLAGIGDGRITDRYGECVLLTVGLGSGDRNLGERVATTPAFGPCDAVIEAFEELAAGEQVVAEESIRYWYGLTTVARPAIAVLGVTGLRHLAVLGLLAAVGYLAWTVGSRRGAWVGLALVAPVILLSDLEALRAVFHHPAMLATGLAGVAVLGRQAAAGAEADRLATATFIFASVYSFLDLMNFVSGIWALAVGVVAMLVPAAVDVRQRARRAAVVAVVWPLGYVTMWLGKWGWAAVATSPADVVDEVAEQFRFRLNGEHDTNQGSIGAGLKANVDHWLDLPGAVPLVVLALFGLLARVVVIARREPAALLVPALVASPVLLVPLFTLVTNNHNEIHYWFEYRSLSLGLGLVLAATVAGGGDRTSGDSTMSAAGGGSPYEGSDTRCP